MHFSLIPCFSQEVPTAGTQRPAVFHLHHKHRSDADVDFKGLILSYLIFICLLSVSSDETGGIWQSLPSPSQRHCCLRTTHLFSVLISCRLATHSYRHTHCPASKSSAAQINRYESCFSAAPQWRTVEDKAPLSRVDLICTQQAWLLYLDWKQHHICPMLAVYITASEKQSCIWLLVAEDSVNSPQTQIKGNVSTGLNGGEIRNIWLKERDGKYALAWSATDADYAEANWPFCSLLNCLDCARLSHSKCFFPLPKFRLPELQFVNKFTSLWEARFYEKDQA